MVNFDVYNHEGLFIFMYYSETKRWVFIIQVGHVNFNAITLKGTLKVYLAQVVKLLPSEATVTSNHFDSVPIQAVCLE